MLSLLALGLTNSEIAASLHLANGTVKTHVSAILRKLGARNRTEAALMSWRPDTPSPSTHSLGLPVGRSPD